MFKFALTALALSFIVLAAQPASAQQAAESTPITLTATVVDLSCNTVYGLAGDGHRMCSQMCFDQGIPLALLAEATRAPGIIAKSSIMLGVGETRDEVLETLDDLAATGIERLTIGQYLQPTGTQLDVVDFVHPDEFAAYGDQARARGIRWVVSSPFARSSYFAEAMETGSLNLNESLKGWTAR